MASKLEMNRKDMEELYQLLCVYRRTYPDRADVAKVIIIDLEMRYKDIYGKELINARNPRNAGRKRKYTEDMDQRIIKLRQENHSMRKIADEEGCSLGRVQKVLKNHGVS